MPTEKYTVSLDPQYAEWGKNQPGGLSELVRVLLREAHERKERNTPIPGDGFVTALLSERTLAKIWDTPEEDETWQDL